MVGAIENSEANIPDGGFAVPSDDPRNTHNRGGLASLSGNTDENTAPGPANMGTTGADLAQTDPQHDLGAVGTGGANSSQIDVSSASSTSLADAETGPPGVGPVEGSRSGVVAPHVEMTDIGLVDLNSADMSVPSAEEDDGTLGARVEDADGNLL